MADPFGVVTDAGAAGRAGGGQLGRMSAARLFDALAETLLADGLERLVAEALDGAGLAPRRLKLELPESADLTVLSTRTSTLAAVRDLGVSITLDDMGAGQSTLRHLAVLPVTDFKIVQAFVAGMLRDLREHAIVGLLSDLGRRLGSP